MPKTHRDLLKRQVAHAHNNLQLGINHISIVGVQFDGVHPELAEGLKIAIELITQADELLKVFVQAAWGKDEINWDSWRNLGSGNLKEIDDE